MLKTLCYKPEDCGFDPRLAHWILIRPNPSRHIVPGVITTSNGYENQESF
jgi:hypothetical protein